MEEPRFGCQHEKFAAARRILMAPHPKGEAESFASAFHECMLALKDLDIEQLDREEPRRWIDTVKRCIDTTDVEDPSGRGKWRVKAEQLTEQEKFEFSNAVAELASWFERVFYGRD